MVGRHATVPMAKARRGEKICRGCHRERNFFRINDACLAGTLLRLHFATGTSPNNSTTIYRKRYMERVVCNGFSVVLKVGGIITSKWHTYINKIAQV